MAERILGKTIIMVNGDKKIEGILVGSVDVPIVENDGGKFPLEDLIARGWWVAE